MDYKSVRVIWLAMTMSGALTLYVKRATTEEVEEIFEQVFNISDRF